MTTVENELEQALRSLRGEAPDTEEYNRLGELYTTSPLIEKLNKLDPFSDQYRATAMELYKEFRGNVAPYDPRRDELTINHGLPQNIWRESSPWFFQSAAMTAEFMLSWGHIIKLLDLPHGSQANILEYGTGSGQLLLFLARIGLNVHAVDIDQPSLDLVEAQATAMKLDVKCENALFGEGFEGKKFDRIIFFEAFHHAWDFEALLDRLAERLEPGGTLILCGEPIVAQKTPGIPFAWGPRVDGLSVFCMRKFGWMELGFTEAFIFELFNRHGWFISDHHIPGFGRATAYVAKRASGTTISAGKPDASHTLFAEGWDAPEVTHRWTNGKPARISLPRGYNATIRFANMLSIDKDVTFRSGGTAKTVRATRSAHGEVTLYLEGNHLLIECKAHRPKDLNKASQDERMLGIAIFEIYLH